VDCPNALASLPSVTGLSLSLSLSPFRINLSHESPYCYNQIFTSRTTKLFCITVFFASDNKKTDRVAFICTYLHLRILSQHFIPQHIVGLTHSLMSIVHALVLSFTLGHGKGYGGGGGGGGHGKGYGGGGGGGHGKGYGGGGGGHGKGYGGGGGGHGKG
jgi:hypothetical protein